MKSLIVIALVAILFVAYSFIPKTHIIKHVTDSRGLTSIVFVSGSDTVALDYLTKDELARLN